MCVCVGVPRREGAAVGRRRAEGRPAEQRVTNASVPIGVRTRPPRGKKNAESERRERERC